MTPRRNENSSRMCEEFFCAVGETRTLMGLLPLAPKASVSTIPPPQQGILGENFCIVSEEVCQSLCFFDYYRGIFVFSMVPGSGTVGMFFLVEMEINREIHTVEFGIAVKSRIA